MKKALLLILVFVMLLSLCACGGESQSTNTPDPAETVENTQATEPEEDNPEPEPETEPIVYEIGDTVSGDIIEVTLDAARFISCIPDGRFLEIWTTGKDKLHHNNMHYEGRNCYPSDGFIIVKCVLSLENIGDTDGFINLGEYSSIKYGNRTFKPSNPSRSLHIDIDEYNGYYNFNSHEMLVAKPISLETETKTVYYVIEDFFDSGSDFPVILNINLPTSKNSREDVMFDITPSFINTDDNPKDVLCLHTRDAIEWAQSELEFVYNYVYSGQKFADDVSESLRSCFNDVDMDYLSEVQPELFESVSEIKTACDTIADLISIDKTVKESTVLEVNEILETVLPLIDDIRSGALIQFRDAA